MYYRRPNSEACVITAYMITAYKEESKMKAWIHGYRNSNAVVAAFMVIVGRGRDAATILNAWYNSMITGQQVIIYSENKQW